MKNQMIITNQNYSKRLSKMIIEDDYRQSSFLKRYNMPTYFLTCTLTDHVITKIKFGFEQP